MFYHIYRRGEILVVSGRETSKLEALELRTEIFHT